MAAVHIAARRAAYEHFFPRDYLEGLTVDFGAPLWVQRMEPSSPWRLCVAAVEEQVVGFVATSVNSFGLDDSVGELMALHVVPEAWGAGIGTALLRDAEAKMVDCGFERAVLRVYEANERARGFYERRGWTSDNVNTWTDRGGSTIAELRCSRLLEAIR